MGKKIAFSAADQALCLGILKQIEVGKINYDLLRAELNLPSRGAAQVRWSRFSSRLKKSVVGGPAKNGPDTPPSTPVGKRKRGRTAKKRKVDSSEEEDEGGMDLIGNFVKEEKKEGGGDHGDVLMEAFQTPTRRLPLRQARVTNFKEVGSDGDGEEEPQEEEFHDSGNGGTTVPSEEAGLSDEEA